jgi:tetratricopeptide (TPR) repeat protein
VDETVYNIDHTDPLGFDFDSSGKSFLEYPPIYLLANVMNSRGIEQERLGNLEKAEKDYIAAIEVNPRYANAYNNLGNVKLKYRDYPRAVANYSKAIQLHPAFVEAYYNRGIARESMEDYDGAAEDYNKAIEINSDYVDAYCRRGALKQILEDHTGAARDFDRVIELDPGSREKMLRFKERAVHFKSLRCKYQNLKASKESGPRGLICPHSWSFPFA